jgi:hypothetical protein
VNKIFFFGFRSLKNSSQSIDKKMFLEKDDSLGTKRFFKHFFDFLVFDVLLIYQHIQKTMICYFTSIIYQRLKFVFQNIFDSEKAQNDPQNMFFQTFYLSFSIENLSFEIPSRKTSHICPYRLTIRKKVKNSAMKIICIATLEEKLLQLNGWLFIKRIVDSRMYCSALNHSYI